MAEFVSASDSTIEPGHLVGPYKLTREIGKGSFAVVYLGKVQRVQAREDEPNSSNTPTNTVTRVAIKVVTRKKLTAKLLDNLEEEISILRTVRHANIVELLDCLKTENHIYLVMQYCRMGDLSNFVKSRKRNGQLSASSPSKRRDPYEEEIDKRYPHPHNGGLHSDLVRSFFAQLAAALQFMRGRKIVHRDIKPQNLLLQEPEQDFIDAGHAAFIPQLKVADFGFARHLEEASLAETLCGSPLYMAPEILRYEKYNAKADLWSVGAVLFEMSVGLPPFRANNHVELLRRIDRGEDKIKFPDERSEDSLRREHARRVEEGRSKPEFVRPHPIDEDIKKLIRELLRRRPIERLSFDVFFNCEVLLAYRANMISSLPQSSTQTSTSSLINGQIPIATRVAPAVPSSVPSSSSVRTEEKPKQSKHVNENVPDSVDTGSSSPPSVSPAPLVNMPQHYFGSKYVVGGLKSSIRMRSRDRLHPITKQDPLPAPQEKAKEMTTVNDTNHDGDASSLEDNLLETPGSSVSHLPTIGQHKPSSAAPALVGTAKVSKESVKRYGINDDDRGYVLVDKRNVEGVEEAAIQSKPRSGSSGGGWSPLGVVRRPSQLGRLTSFGAISPLVQAATRPPQSSSASPSPGSTNAIDIRSNNATSNASSNLAKGVPVAQPNRKINKETNINNSPSPILNRLGSTPPNAPFALPPNVRKPSFSRRTSSSNEASRLSTMRPPQSPRPGVAQLIPPTSSPKLIVNQAAATAQIQQSNHSPIPSTSSSIGTSQQPTSALARAISMASVRLFGVPTGMVLKGAEVRKSLRMGLGSGTYFSSSPSQNGEATGYSSGNGSIDIAEQNLLCLLHEYSHKAYVLTEFADARLSTYYHQGPHQNNYVDKRRNSGSSLSSAMSGSVTRNTGQRGESERLTSSKAEEEEEDLNTNTLPSSNQEENQSSLAEIAASEAYVLYVRSLSFVQRAIQAAEDFLESRSQSASRYSNPSIHSPSQIVINSLFALRSKFQEGSERAKFARSKSTEEFPESVQQIDELIFSEALRIARTGALTELSIERSSDSKPIADQCILHYGTACTMLQGLLDPAEQTDELPSFAINCVEKFIGSISRRMACIQENYDNLSVLII